MEYGNLRVSHGQWPFIVSFPTKKWWFVHSFLYVYQRVALQIYLGMMNYWAGEAGKPVRLDMSAWFDRQFPGCFWWLEHVGTCWNWALKHDFSKLSVTNLEELGYWEISFWCYCKYNVFLFWTMFFFFSIDCWWFLWTLAKWDVNWSKLMRNILEPGALKTWGFWCLYQTSLERWRYDTYNFLINRDTPDTVNKLDWIPSLWGILIKP